MKHVETVKSVVLISLIILSISLTFTIWTYTPNLETIAQPPTIETAIANEKEIEAIIKPYKLLFSLEEGLTGTVGTDEIGSVISTLKGWRITDLEIADPKFDEKKLNAFLRTKDHFTLLFQEEIPISVYRNVLNLDEKNVPDFSFDRIIVDWNQKESSSQMHFISRANGFRYSAKVTAVNLDTLLLKGMDYAAYTEANPKQTTRFIAVPENPIKLIRNTSYAAEISPSKFRDALFSDRNAVTRSQVGLNNEEYQDDHSLMSVNTMSKKLQYVYPLGESNEVAMPSDLLLNTIDFMNEHAGWTDDFRFSYMDPSRRYVKFQLYAEGLPVFSTSLPTEIEEVWGEEEIFRYARPYYTLDYAAQATADIEVLPSGKEVAEILMASAAIDFNLIDEITPGYFMKLDTDLSIFILEPSWYYVINDHWIRFSPDQFGGEKIGLE